MADAVPPLAVAGVTSSSLKEGTLILDGRFRIEGLLGGGGMGLVYRARQVSLSRSVAVKVLRDDVSHAQLGERFRREAQLLSQVEHPAVVRVIDFGPLGESMCLVMEYVEGETLEKVLQREAPLSVDRVERLVVQLAEGLAAIHARGIVHRDLKPDNVVLTTDAAGQVQARLLDFGIARLMEPEAGAAVTQGGLVLGTPEYLAPEQALGQSADARSDLYSLGLIAWRALIGHHPFAGPSVREFVAQQLHEVPAPLVQVAPHLAAFPALVATITACLSKDPFQRPQDAQSLLELLRRVPVQLTLEAKRPEVKAPPSARGRWRWLALGAVLVAVAAGALWVRADPLRRVRRLLESGRGSEALQVIDDSPEQAASWSTQMLRAAAMHQVGRHEDEWKVLAQVPATETAEPLALEGLTDDFGHAETPKLRKILAGFSKATALPSLQALARSEPQRWAQWGALRFVDLEYAGQGLALGELYGQALVSRDCGTRRVAVHRLVELRNPSAIAALRALKETPKVGASDCGQDAASQALVRLEKELPSE